MKLLVINIYSYNWWEVLSFIIGLELAALLVAIILVKVWSGNSLRRGWRKKKRPSSNGYKSGLA